MTVVVPWQVRDPLWAQGGLMKMSEGGLLLERLAVEQQGVHPHTAKAQFRVHKRSACFISGDHKEEVSRGPAQF